MTVVLDYKLPLILEPEDPELRRTLDLYRRNSEWMSEHGKPFYDQYLGQFVAVSEGETFVSPDAQEAERLAREKHPSDTPFVIYIPKIKCERIYAC
ncbi:MAG: hypothetical protein HYR56_23250 [Acidobacteria bacterium]|nr:hypothetical protein [Acidobacteriota bacterium]MBI3426107.1 hypothetical protein [Acidobacteriota bacterium]